MANNYEKILELANANNMGLSNTIKRDFGIPLDYTSVQASYEAALTYAATNTLAYVGQPISVGDKLYIVTAESQGKYPAEVADGESQIDVFLAEVGSATEGDGKTISLVDGVLSLYGIDGKDQGTYVPSLVNGVLTWNKPDTTTVDGLAAAVEGLEDRADALEAVVGKAAEGDDEATGLVKAVADNTAAIATEKSERETAISGEASARDAAIKAVTDSIGAVAEGKTVVEMIQAAEDAAKAAIPTVVSAFTNDAGYLTEHQDITGKADKATTLAGYGIGDAYTKDEVDSIVSGMTHMSTSIVDAAPSVDDAKEGVIYLVPDATSEAGTYIEYILVTATDGSKSVEQIGSTKTDLSDYAKTQDVNTALDLKADASSVYTKDDIDGKVQTIDGEIAKKLAISDYNTDKATFALKSDVETGLAGKVDTSALSSYYTKTDADALLAVKADKETVTAALATKVETAQIRHTSEGVGEGVTKDGTSLTITVDAYTKGEVYTKSETDNQIDAKIASVTGGESAADVKLALESYRDAINSEIWGDAATAWTTTTEVDGKTVVTYTPQYGTTSRVDTLESAVSTLQTNVGKNQTDISDLSTAVSTLETNKVDVNTQAIAGIQATISGENGLSARIGALESKESQHSSDYSALKAKVDTAVDTIIPALSGRVDATESAITTINGTLDTHASDIAKKANASDVYTKGEVDEKVKAAIDAIPEIDLDPYATTEYVNTELGKKADASALDSYYTKTEADTAFMTEKEVDDRINALIVASDPEGGKTITDIQNLVKYVDENASEIAALVTATGANTAKLEGIETTVVAAIATAKQEAIAAATYTLAAATADNLGGIKSASGDNKVSVDTDGVASVATVNVNSLTQTTGDTLIINGGSASI